MTFNALGFVLANAFTQKLEDRQRATQLNLMGAMMGDSPLGLVMVASLANQTGGSGGGSGPPGPGGGSALVLVPDVRPADSYDEAAELLTGLGLKAIRADTKTEDSDIGTVLGSIPDAGELVRPGTTVTVAVSVGRPVPDVVGMDSGNATEVLRLVGFAADVYVVSHQSTGPDKVFKQDPAAGETLLFDEQPVKLWITPPKLNDGSEETGTSTTAVATVTPSQPT